MHVQYGTACAASAGHLGSPPSIRIHYQVPPEVCLFHRSQNLKQLRKVWSQLHDILFDVLVVMHCELVSRIDRAGNIYFLLRDRRCQKSLVCKCPSLRICESLVCPPGLPHLILAGACCSTCTSVVMFVLSGTVIHILAGMLFCLGTLTESSRQLKILVSSCLLTPMGSMNLLWAISAFLAITLIASLLSFLRPLLLQAPLPRSERMKEHSTMCLMPCIFDSAVCPQRIHSTSRMCGSEQYASTIQCYMEYSHLPCVTSSQLYCDRNVERSCRE